MNPYFLFLQFEGRISRLWWWLGMLAVVAFEMLVEAGLYALFSGRAYWPWQDDQPEGPGFLIGVMAFFITLRPSLALDIKRIHDVGKTAWLVVPAYAGELIVLLGEGLGISIIDHAFGQVPGLSMTPDGKFMAITPFSHYMSLFFITAWLLYIIYYIYLTGFRRGEGRANQYGPSPLEAAKPQA